MRFFLIILALLGVSVFTSCEKNLTSTENAEFDTLISLRNSLDVQTLVSMHNNSRELVHRNVRLFSDTRNDIESAFEYFEDDLESGSIEDFWEQHGMTQIMEAAEYFLNNETNRNVYGVLLSDFNLTASEYEKMFLIVEGAKIVPLVLPDEFPDGIGARYACAAAVAGYVFQVGMAVTIGGPVGLAAWAVGIGFAATGIVSSCGSI